MKREKRLTKRERKLTQGPSAFARPAPHHHHHDHQHIHCIACGKHLDAESFGEPDGADFVRCQHGSDFPACVGCYDKAKVLVDEHDRTNTDVKRAAAWH